ncbi:MAG: arsenate reductase ArsC [Nitrosopumilaceae archaeon]|nr:arsenate reductase ArsC [Nitrosopumilaceae archaeon]
MARHEILFVCVENAGRSQMAEAFFRKYAPKKYLVSSAGTKPSNRINPIVSEVMREVGIDIDSNVPQALSNKMIESSTKAVNMGCMDKESCPALFVDDVLDWNISDPKGKSIEEVRKIRDEIEIRVKELIKILEENSQ